MNLCVGSIVGVDYSNMAMGYSTVVGVVQFEEDVQATIVDMVYATVMLLLKLQLSGIQIFQFRMLSLGKKLKGNTIYYKYYQLE